MKIVVQPPTEDVEKYKNDKRLGSIAFFLVGISTLIGWNAILTALDFFQTNFSFVNISFIIGVPYGLGLNIFGLLLVGISKYIPLKSRLIFGFLINTAFMILMPIQSYLQKGSHSGLWVFLIIVFLFAAFSSISQNSAIAFASIFDKDPFVPLLFTGQGIAGILIGLVQMVLLAIFSSSSGDSGAFVGTVVYFIISGIVIVISIFVIVMFMNTRYCKIQLHITKVQLYQGKSSIFGSMVVSNNELKSVKDQKSGNKDLNVDQIKKPLIENEAQKYLVDPNSVSYEPEKDEKKTSENKGFLFQMSQLRKALPLPIVIWFNFVITFIVYPGISIGSQKGPDTMMNPSWKFCLFIFMFNLFDTTGRYITEIKFYTRKHPVIVSILRCLLYIFFFLDIKDHGIPVINTWWFPFIVMALFGLSNGFDTGSSMTLAPSFVEGENKQIIGFWMALLLLNGIFVGQLIAYFAFKNIS